MKPKGVTEARCPTELMKPQICYVHRAAPKQAVISTLKREYLACLASVWSSATSLRDTIQRLIQVGVERTDLIQWAIDAGHRQSYVRSLLSRILCELGVRARKPGAGRRPAPESMLIAAQSRERYGKKATSFLFGAHRISKAQDTAESESDQSSAISISLFPPNCR
jgi:hypothetical protein